MTLQQAIEIHTNLSMLQKTNIHFPGAVAFKIIYNIRQLTPIVKDAYSLRESIVEQYGDGKFVEENGVQYVQVAERYREDAQRELEELAQTEIDIKLYKIQLKDIENINMSAEEMNLLYDMIEEG